MTRFSSLSFYNIYRSDVTEPTVYVQPLHDGLHVLRWLAVVARSRFSIITFSAKNYSIYQLILFLFLLCPRGLPYTSIASQGSCFRVFFVQLWSARMFTPPLEVARRIELSSYYSWFFFSSSRRDDFVPPAHSSFELRFHLFWL